MRDIFFPLVALAFFVLAALLVTACERLVGAPDETTSAEPDRS
jgi:hypothetical protein